MRHPSFVCIFLTNSIFGEFSNIYLLPAQSCVKWRHKTRPIAKYFRLIFILFLRQTKSNWCPERYAKLCVDTISDGEVIPEKPWGSDLTPPPPGGAGDGLKLYLRIYFMCICVFLGVWSVVCIPTPPEVGRRGDVKDRSPECKPRRIPAPRLADDSAKIHLVLNTTRCNGR